MVEQVDGEKRKQLHIDYRPVEIGVTIERTVRIMLARAAEQFPDRTKAVQRHD